MVTSAVFTPSENRAFVLFAPLNLRNRFDQDLAVMTLPDRMICFGSIP